MNPCFGRDRFEVGFTRARTIPWILRPVLLATWPLLAATVCAGCKCEGNAQKPFTPFGVATEVRPAVEPGAQDSAPTDSQTAKEFARIAALTVNPPATEIEVDGQQYAAPDGSRVAQYLVADWGGEQGREVVARIVSERPGDKAAAGVVESLVLLSPGGRAKTLAPFPTYIPRNAECTSESVLQTTGPHTLTWDVGANCPAGTLIPRAPQRSLLVVDPLASTPIRLHLRLADPAPGERLEVEVNSEDRDNDGHDDATLTFRLSATPPAGAAEEGKPPSPAEARLAWLDRAAGMARDNAEPKKSFAELGSLENVRAKGPNTSRQVELRIQFARRLYAYLCKEAATYRLTDVDGSALACGETTSVMDSWVSADVTAALTQHHYAKAILALEQGAWFGGGVSTKTQAALEKSLGHALTERRASALRIEARVASPPPGPHYSPLRFAREALLIQGPEGVQRWQDGTLEDASDEIDPWSLVAFGPAGQRLVQLAFPCNDSTLFGTSQSNAGVFGTALTTNILSPRPGVCGGNGAQPDIELRPVAWAPEGLSAYIGPVAVGPTARFRQPGAPQSPSGAFSITTTRLGLLIQGPERAEVWRTTPEFSAADCVIADSGALAACLDDRQVVVLRAEQP